MAGCNSLATRALPAFPYDLTRPLAVKANGVKCIQMFYSRGRFPLQLDRRIIANPFDPRHSECQARYRAFADEDLIIDVNANQSGGKAVQRKWAALSIRRALFLSFAQIGLDPLGRHYQGTAPSHLIESQQTLATAREQTPPNRSVAKSSKTYLSKKRVLHPGLWDGPLMGTLAVYASPPIQKSPYQRIQDEMDLLVLSLTSIARPP